MALKPNNQAAALLPIIDTDYSGRKSIDGKIKNLYLNGYSQYHPIVVCTFWE